MQPTDHPKCKPSYVSSLLITFLLLAFNSSTNAGTTGTIKAVHSDKCLDVPASSTAEGLQLIQYSCHTGDHQ